MSRIVAALSGGVDSAVATARMLDAGHDVMAVHLSLSGTSSGLFESEVGQRGCLSSTDTDDARKVADHLGVDFDVWDFSDAFSHEVVEDFLSEYAAGRTPNPCLRCNARIKFGALVDRAIDLGFDGIVTGHYARLVTSDDGIVELHRGADMAKDQSYVLGVLTQERLRHACFPLGDSRKEDVRREAQQRGLSVASKPDSYDICFIPGSDTARYLHDALGSHLGEIVDEDGTVLGHHEGAFTYTVGQRKGLSIGRPAPDGKPRYVLRVDAPTNRVVVGPKERLRIDSLTGINPLWSQSAPTEASITVQLRAHSGELPAILRVMPGEDAARVTVDLERPAYGIAPGQSAVFYDGTRVLGSAVIESVQ